MSASLEMVFEIADMLGDHVDQVVFVGGAIIPLLLDDPHLRPTRVTTDVDVIVEIATLTDYYSFEEALRARGFQNDPAGPICRYRTGHLALDVMPSDPDILGFSNPWYPHVIRGAVMHGRIRHGSAACILATKFEAFESPSRRYGGDFYASHDLEDAITVLDGRSAIIEEMEIADPEVSQYCAQWLAVLLAHPDYEEVIETHLASDPASKNRAEIVDGRIRAIVNSFNSRREASAP